VTVTLKVPADSVSHESVDEPLPVILVTDRAHLRPVGSCDSVRLTVPVKPFIAVTEIVEVPVTPWAVFTTDGLAVML